MAVSKIGAVRGGVVDEGAGAAEEEDRVDFEANLTSFNFLHISSWARWRVFLLAPVFLAAKRRLRLKEYSLAGADRLVPKVLDRSGVPAKPEVGGLPRAVGQQRGELGPSKGLAEQRRTTG